MTAAMPRASAISRRAVFALPLLVAPSVDFPVEREGLVAGALLTASFAAQVIRTWVTSSARDISWSWLIAFTDGISLWAVYSYRANALSLLISEAATAALLAALIAAKLRADRGTRGAPIVRLWVLPAGLALLGAASVALAPLLPIALTGGLAGIYTTGAFIPQVTHTWRTRSARDVSWAWLVTFTVSVLVWLHYAARKGSIPLLLTQIATLALLAVLIAGKLPADRRALIGQRRAQDPSSAANRSPAA